MEPEPLDVRIDPSEASRRIESGGAVALDVVQPGGWDRIDGAVKGAVRIPPEEIPDRFRELPDLDIIAYCT
jgi:rhodanese-related sulfurtransferase